jgi:hypothetical protein
MKVAVKQTSCSQILSHFMGVKASYGVGLKSAQAWGCPWSMKCLFKDIRSTLTPFLPLSVLVFTWKPVPPFPFVGGWIADYVIDFEIRWIVVDSGIGSHTPCFSLDSASGIHLLTEWLGTHERIGYTSCKDDLMAYPLCIWILFDPGPFNKKKRISAA